MGSIFLAFSFLRVPKLFLSLLLWPLLLGLIVFTLQLGFTYAFLATKEGSSGSYETRIKEVRENSVLRDFLYGSGAALPPITVCRWKSIGESEVPPSPQCEVGPYDVALHTSHPESFDPSEYAEFFSGSIARLHLCKECAADIEMTFDTGDPVTDIRNPFALMVYSLVEIESKAASEILPKLLEERRRSKQQRGTMLLHAPGSRGPINFSRLEEDLAFVANIAALAVLVFWLALRSHRKVLDYFSQNGALLPLVAACGKKQFYRALWIITGLRVGAFLAAALPMPFLFMTTGAQHKVAAYLESLDPIYFALWFMGVVVGLGAVTLVASIGELQHRRHWSSFLIKYVPAICCLIGTILWFALLFISAPPFRVVQDLIAALPIIGLIPVMLSHIVTQSIPVLVTHLILAALMVGLILRYNSRWFAAHLEEV